MLASPARLGLGLAGGWAGPVSVCLGHCCQTLTLLLQKSSLREQLSPELGQSGGASNLKGFTSVGTLPSPCASSPLSAGSSCLVAYKKTPPPVPPRTTSKPFISVTVQSSTESAQDTYLDSQDHKSEVTSQSGLSNSSDSLDSSTRPPSVTRGGVTPAPEAPEPPPKHAALKSEQGTLTSSESHPEAIPKRKLSSIGIQVGVPFTLLCPQPTLCTCLCVITSGGGPLGLRGKVVCLYFGGWLQVAEPNSTHSRASLAFPLVLQSAAVGTRPCSSDGLSQ